MISDLFLFDLVLLLLVTLTAIAVIEVRDLFASAMLAGLYSLLMAMVYFNMHAVDVAFTEAAVGAGISTILLIGALVYTGRKEKRSKRIEPGAVLLVVITGAALLYGTIDMPAFGDPDAPLHTHRGERLLLQTVGKVDGHELYTEAYRQKHWHDHNDVHGYDHAGREWSETAWQNDFFIHGAPHVPNTVSSLLADYRSFDTMFEVAVILTAGLSMLILLRRREEDPAASMDTSGHDTMRGSEL